MDQVSLFEALGEVCSGLQAANPRYFATDLNPARRPTAEFEFETGYVRLAFIPGENPRVSALVYGMIGDTTLETTISTLFKKSGFEYRGERKGDLSLG